MQSVKVNDLSHEELLAIQLRQFNIIYMYVYIALHQ